MSKMINVMLKTNAGARVKNVSSATTLREFYGNNGVNYAACSNTVNSVPVHADDLEKTLGQLSGNADEMVIASIVKQDCAAKIYVHVNTAEVKSSVKLEDWKKVLKYDPDFGLYDDEGDILFSAGIEESGWGGIGKHGVMWSSNTGEDGLAVVSVGFKPDVEDRKEAVKEDLGRYLADLNMLESCVAEALEDANRIDKEIEDSIVMM